MRGLKVVAHHCDTRVATSTKSRNAMKPRPRYARPSAPLPFPSTGSSDGLTIRAAARRLVRIQRGIRIHSAVVASYAS
jgi:hypothetical protein